MTKRVVLIGHPWPFAVLAMQQAAFNSLGIDATYEAWDRALIELADAIDELRTEAFLGANVTIPHKERVVPMVDRLTEEAHTTAPSTPSRAKASAWSGTTWTRPASRSRSTGSSASRRCRARPSCAAPAAGPGRSSTA